MFVDVVVLNVAGCCVKLVYCGFWFATVGHVALGLQYWAGLFALACIILPWTVMLIRLNDLLFLQMYCFIVLQDDIC